MRRAALLPAVLAAGLASAPLAHAQGAARCVGHELLSTPRPEDSCLTVNPRVYPSPDRALRAVVWPVGMALHATPDIESRVVIRADGARLVTSKDHSSPRGTNGHYVVQARWSPDSRFFVYSMASSGGHAPWQFPTFVFTRDKGVIVSLNELIGGPTTSEHFTFSGPHTLTAETWEREGSDKRIQITIDLADVIGNIVQ
jgi:hypothetical protein